MAEEWTTIVFRNGVKLDLPQQGSDVIDQMARASKSGGLSLLALNLRDGAVALVSAPDIVAVAVRDLAADGNMAMLHSTRAVIEEADRVTEIKRDADGMIVSSVSRAVRA